MTDRETLLRYRMFNARQVADYKELVVATSEEAVDALEAAKQFVAEIKKVVSEQ